MDYVTLHLIAKLVSHRLDSHQRLERQAEEEEGEEDEKDSGCSSSILNGSLDCSTHFHSRRQ